jgi:uncharacterized lipoprotein YddW (UPF0748 family)
MGTMDRRDALKFLAAGPLAVAALGSSAAGSLTRQSGVGANPATARREFRSAWVASVDNIDWPSRPGLDTATQRAEIDRILDTSARMELNALFLQVRPTGDALYRSDIEPWSAFLTGRQGTGPSPSYDPLEYWIKGAHARGMDLHAWVNPFRVRHPKSIGPDADNHPSQLFPKLTRRYGEYLWLDPGAVQAREITTRVIDDLLTRYDLDGLHMDDYFYPYPQDKVPFPDKAIFETYRRNGGTLGHDDWRRENINRFVRDINSLVHRRKPGALFTISPFGIWRPGNPTGVVGFDAYAGLYADSRRWLAEGWCDALMPQLYWPMASKGQPFQPLMRWWLDQNRSNRHVWPGLYLTRVLRATDGSGSGWAASEIIDQVRTIQQEPRASGFALFSMVGLLENRRNVADLLRAGPLASPALVPESPWLNAPKPLAPAVRVTATRIDLRVEITPAPSGPPVRRYVAQLEPASGGRGWILPAPEGTTRVTLNPSVPPSSGATLVVTPIGRNGTTGNPSRTPISPG